MNTSTLCLNSWPCHLLSCLVVRVLTEPFSHVVPRWRILSPLLTPLLSLHPFITNHLPPLALGNQRWPLVTMNLSVSAPLTVFSLPGCYNHRKIQFVYICWSLASSLDPCHFFTLYETTIVFLIIENNSREWKCHSLSVLELKDFFIVSCSEPIQRKHL